MSVGRRLLSARWRRRPCRAPLLLPPGHLQAPPRRPSSSDRLQPGAVTVSTVTSRRPRAGRSSWSSAAPAQPLSPEGPDRHRAGQLSPHLSTKSDTATGLRPTTTSWHTCRPTRRRSTGSSPTSPRCATSAIDGSDHRTTAKGPMVRRYILWRNRNKDDEKLRHLIKRKHCLISHVPRPTALWLWCRRRT